MTTLSTPRRVFITGGAQGIGRSLVEHFVQAGDHVAFCDLNVSVGNELAQNTGAQFFALDVCDVEALEAAMQQLFDLWGDIDVIVNNVGVGFFRPITEVSVADFEQALHTNLRPVFITARLLALHRERLGHRLSLNDLPLGNEVPTFYGRIVNICSTRHLQSEAGTEGYAASKGGIRSLTHALAVSLAPYRITVNCLSPGWIHVRPDEQLRPINHAFHPSGRVGRPDDIARAALFLCERNNDFITGQNLTIDGGATIQMIYPED